MSFSYVKIANERHPRKGKRIRLSRINETIIEDLLLKDDVKVYLDGRKPARRLKDIDGAIKEEVFARGVLKKFLELREKSNKNEESSLRSLERLSSRLIGWCPRKDFASRLCFLRSVIRAILENYSGALSDLDDICADLIGLQAHPEFEYLVRHNRAVLLILQGNPRGFSNLVNIYQSNTATKLPNKIKNKGDVKNAAVDVQTGKDASDGRPDESVGDSKQKTDKDGSNKINNMILPTIIAIHEILEKVEGLDETYRPSGFDDFVKLEVFKEAQRTYRDIGKINWASEIRIWSDGEEFRPKKEGMGLALLLNINRDEDKIAQALAENRKIQNRDFDDCAKAYGHCQKECSEGDIVNSLKQFVYARERHLKLLKHSHPLELNELFEENRAAFSDYMNKDVEDLTNCYYDLILRQDHRGNNIEVSLLKFLQDRLDELRDIRGNMFVFIKDDCGSAECSQLAMLIERLQKCRLGFLYVWDLLSVGYYNKKEALFQNGFNTLVYSINEQKEEWGKRLVSNEAPWSIDSTDLKDWRFTVRACWSALIAEYCLKRLREFLSEDIVSDDIRSLFKDITEAIDGLIFDAENNLGRLSCADILDGININIELLKNSALYLIYEFSTIINKDIKMPETPSDVEPYTDRIIKAVKMKDQTTFPSEQEAEKQDIVKKLFGVFDTYYPEDPPVTCLTLDPVRLEPGKKIMKEIDDLKVHVMGDKLNQDYNRYKSRILILEAWSRLQQLKKGEKELNADEVDKVEKKFKNALGYQRNAPLALWGLAHLKIMETKFSPWEQDSMLHAFGHSDHELNSVTSRQDIPEPTSDELKLGIVTRERFELFSQAIDNIIKDEERSDESH